MHEMRVGSGASRLQALVTEVDRRFASFLRDQLSTAGFDDVSIGMATLVRALDGDGPTSEGLLPSRLGITKQAVSQHLRRLSQSGYVKTSLPSEGDMRMRVLQLTRRGRKLQDAVSGAADAVRSRVDNILGTARSAALEGGLEIIAKVFEYV